MKRISLCLFIAIKFVYFVLCHLGWGRAWTWVYDPPMTSTILSGRWVGDTGCPTKSSTKGGHPIAEELRTLEQTTKHWFICGHIVQTASAIRSVTKAFRAWGKLLHCAPPPPKNDRIRKFYINVIHFAPLHALCLGRVPHLPHPCYGSECNDTYTEWASLSAT
jgi:hypothetical protein